MASSFDSSATTLPTSRYDLKQPRSMTSSARDGFICVKVGPSLKATYVHKALLTHHSHYFQDSLTGPWKEAEDRTITLTDIKPVIFDIFIDWMYTGNFPTDSGELQALEDETGDTIDEDSDDRFAAAMVMAYAFGDHFLASGFQRAVLDNLVRYINHRPTWFFATVYAFKHLREDSPILQALIDVHCRYWDAEYFDQMSDKDKELSELLPATFWIRAVGKLATKETSDDWWSKPLDPCDYHEHATVEERKECSSK